MTIGQTPHESHAELPRIKAGDDRYQAVVDKQFNKRFRARPEYVRLAHSTEEVIVAVEDAVREGQRIVVTSGGHCLEGFVSDPDVRVIIDVSPMKRIWFDESMRAVAVEGGATVGETFQALFGNWGVVVPLGEYPHIGMGGHVVGGAFGFLCRQLGLAADYLYAVEVVTVDARGRAQGVVATRESSDPNRELWWAHTGGGGGNFGIVTKYWFRDPGSSGDDPARFLPPAPESVTTFEVEWDWKDIDRHSFARLLTNHGRWCEENSGADSPDASLSTLLEVHRREFGKIFVRGLSTAGASAERQIDAHLAALGSGIAPPRPRTRARVGWLDFALDPFPELFGMPPGGVNVKVKDALLTKRLTDRQVGVAYDYLTSSEYQAPGGVFGLATYGGRINTVAPDTTASAARNAILDMACNAGWLDSREQTQNLAWVRAFYRDLFADTGGVPVPGDRYAGSLINHPDTDHADSTLNTSRVAWPVLYYQRSYERLQRAKARWDPRNVFHHALSIRAL
ncbi:MAG TPA: FAD-binding oxidoreductase [Gemmatimonadaceae bacterium]